MTDAPSFSLVTQPWIHCVTRGGEPILASLRDIFDAESSLLEVRGDSPTQDYAVLRVLLAMYWRAHARDAAVTPGGSFDHEEWFEEQWDSAASGQPDEAALSYLDSVAPRLDLRDPERPFMQVADLARASGSALPISRIIPDAEHNYFTMRTGEGRASIPADEAARWLITVQAYDYSGTKPGAVGDPRVKKNKGYPIGTGWAGRTGGTVVLGRTLRETLILNTPAVVLDPTSVDLPPWERKQDTAAERMSTTPSGPVDLATWQSRRVRLIWEENRASGVLVCNGDQIPDGGANVFSDPMTPYQFNTNKSPKNKDVFDPRPYDTDRMMWHSLEPLLALSGDIPIKRGEKAPKRPAVLDSLGDGLKRVIGRDADTVEVRLISASYGTRYSTAATTVDARVGFPNTLLSSDSTYARRSVFAAARATLDAARALGVFGTDLLEAAGANREFDATTRDRVLGELEEPFVDWLRSLPSDTERIDAAATAWQEHVRDHLMRSAQQILEGAGSRALIGKTVKFNGHTRVLNAGSAHRSFTWALRKALPLATSATSNPDEKEES